MTKTAAAVTMMAASCGVYCSWCCCIRSIAIVPDLEVVVVAAAAAAAAAAAGTTAMISTKAGVSS